jgi:putative addiction module killer protein
MKTQSPRRFFLVRRCQACRRRCRRDANQLRAGYRVYCTEHGKQLVILLCGGDKSTQRSDINQAIQMAGELKE